MCACEEIHPVEQDEHAHFLHISADLVEYILGIVHTGNNNIPSLVKNLQQRKIPNIFNIFP